MRIMGLFSFEHVPHSVLTFILILTISAINLGCNNFSDDDEVATGSRSPKSSPKIVKKSAEKARKQRRTSATPNIAQMLKSSFNPAGFFKQGEDEASPFTGSSVPETGVANFVSAKKAVNYEAKLCTGLAHLLVCVGVTGVQRQVFKTEKRKSRSKKN